MKKLLSILGAMGLVATAGASVVACGETSVDNNPSVNYKTFDGWVQDSINNKTTDIIFIGGRTDADSLSFLGAVENYVNTDSKLSQYNTLIDQNHINDIDDSFNTLANNSNSQVLNNFANIWSPTSNDPTVTGPAVEASRIIWGDSNDSVQPDSSKHFKLHSILADDISSFFKNGLGSEIIDKFLKEQIKEAHDWKYKDKQNTLHMSDKDKERKVNETLNGVKDKLKGETGPFFMAITNGRLVGISTGYKNYKFFNKQMRTDSALTGKTEYDLNHVNALNDINALINNLSVNGWGNFYKWYNDNLIPDKKGETLTFSNKDIKLSQGWDKVNTGTKYDPNDDSSSKPSDSSSSDNSSNGDSSSTKSFAIDPTKYIN